MGKIVVTGGKPLCGEISVQGAKNSVLPILAASYLADGECLIHNCPRLTDVRAAVRILKALGSRVTVSGNDIRVDSSGACGCEIPDELMREMRSSVVFLGAVLAKCGRAVLSAPGGCDIGLRPIDLHISAMRRLGVEITEEHGRQSFECPAGLRGIEIVLSFPSVGATENIMLAAACAKGRTVIVNAAREPEIGDLADFLTSCGAKIKSGEGIIQIEGVPSLHGAEHTVIPDRIAAATYLCAAAATGGCVTLRNVIPAHIGAVLPPLEKCGCDIYSGETDISLSAPRILSKIGTVRTMPYPGFPTDAQAPLMAVAAVSAGTSVFIENIFENRFKHVSELCRLGAKIKVEGRVAVVEGASRLSGAPVVASDLRGGASLIIAALAARGETEIDGVRHIDRGYEDITGCLGALGAEIVRRSDDGKEAEKEQCKSSAEIE